MRFDRGGLLAIGIFAIALVVLLYLYNRAIPGGVSASTNTAKMIEASFSCPGGKSIDATFTDGKVSLHLSDGREFTLPQGISGSGARYTNEDESFVFWNKGDGAFIEENGTTTYQDCKTSGPHD